MSKKIKLELTQPQAKIVLEALDMLKQDFCEQYGIEGMEELSPTAKKVHMLCDRVEKIILEKVTYE